MKFLAPAARLSTVLTVLGLCVAGCGKKTAPDVLARVGEQVITVDDFQTELQYRTANRQPVPAERAALLDQMITRLTLVQQAKADGLEKSPDVHRLYEEMLIARLKEKELDPQRVALKVLPGEIQAEYERDAARFTQPAKAQLAIIFVAADPKFDTNRLAEMAARAAEARQLAIALPVTEKGFGPVAAGYSEDQVTRYRGGDAGWFTADLLASRWPREVINIGLALSQIGETSEVIHAGNGFYFVKKMDARPPVITPLVQVQGTIVHRLLTDKSLQLEVDFNQSLRAGKVQTNLDLLARVTYPAPNPMNMASRPPAAPGNP